MAIKNNVVENAGSSFINIPNTVDERPLDTFQLTNYNDTADRGTLVPSNDSFDVDASTDERPLDNFNLYNYDESADRGVLGPNKEDLATQLENNIENGNITPEQLPENSPIQKEAEQITDNNPHNDEVRNDAVEDFLKQMEAEKVEKPVDDGGTDFDYGRAYTNKVELNDAAKKAAEDLGLGNLDPEVKHGYYGDYGDTMKFANKLEKYKKEGIKDKFKSPFDGMSYEDVKQAAKSRKNATNFKTTLKDARAEKAYLDGKGSILETKPSVYWPKERLDEYKAELAKEISRYENYDNVADKTYVLSRLAQKAKFVNQVEEALKYSNAANGIDVNTYNEKPVEKHTDETEGIGGFLPALNLQDYHKDVALNGERELDTTETDDVEDADYRVVEDSDYVPPTYTIDDLDREIEETTQWPVTNAEEAKAKQKKLKKLKARRVAYGGTSKSDTDWDYDKSGATGGKVSPRAGIGSIGGAAGHGSMASTSPTKVVDNHNSIASKAPLPHALEDNQGKVVSVNGKATTAPSSNNNGAFRSGSFGLMSKASSNLKSIKSKAPISGGAKHTGSSMAGVNGMPEINLDDGKQLLIERLEQLLTQLTDEEKKEFGFSASLNQWNGKALTKLDGYTLQDLIDKVEEYLGEK